MSKLDKITSANHLCLVGSNTGECEECVWYKAPLKGDECSHSSRTGLGTYGALPITIKKLSNE